jgi:heme/copper-type cytochrome/quinol oxidase subunit 2
MNNMLTFAVIGVVIAVSVVYNVVKFKSLKETKQKYLEEHPDAAKVYLSLKALVALGSVTVHSVDGGEPAFFMENVKRGFYAMPGKRTVEMSYSYSRPGVIHKHVTQTYGPYKKELVIEPDKNYLLGFDREQETFTFAEA